MNHYLRLVTQPMRIRFEFRKSRTQSSSLTVLTDPPGRLYVILSLAGTHYGPYGTSINATLSIWKSRRSARLSDEAVELNRQIAHVQNQYETAHAELTRQNSYIAHPLIIDGPMVQSMLARLKTGGVQPIKLTQVYREFYTWKTDQVQDNRKLRKDGQIATSTLKTYPKRWVLIQQFLQSGNQAHIPVANVTYGLATELTEWLGRTKSSRAHKKPYDQATIAKVVKLLKMLLVYAQSKNYIHVSPLATFTVAGGSAANPRPLTKEQMQLLENCDLPPVLRHQCDSWLVAAELCLHYSDYMRLPGMDFVLGESGTLYIQHERQKQSGREQVQTVNVTPRAKRILAKYDGPEGLYYGSSAYFSKQLKRIAVLANLRDKDGVVIPLQFGQGRDTGLTRRAVQGANNAVITKIGGWRSPAFANRYINDDLGIVDGFSSTLNAEED